LPHPIEHQHRCKLDGEPALIRGDGYLKESHRCRTANQPSPSSASVKPGGNRAAAATKMVRSFMIKGIEALTLE